MLCRFRRLRLMSRLVLRRLLRFSVGSCLVRATEQSLMGLSRFSRMRAMPNHRFVSFGEQAE